MRNVSSLRARSFSRWIDHPDEVRECHSVRLELASSNLGCHESARPSATLPCRWSTYPSRWSTLYRSLITFIFRRHRCDTLLTLVCARASTHSCTFVNERRCRNVAFIGFTFPTGFPVAKRQSIYLSVNVHFRW